MNVWRWIFADGLKRSAEESHFGEFFFRGYFLKSGEVSDKWNVLYNTLLTMDSKCSGFTQFHPQEKIEAFQISERIQQLT